MASHPLPDTDPIRAKFPDETIFVAKNIEEQKTWTFYFDGALNSKGKGVRAVLTSPEGVIIPRACQLAFLTTHNIAE